MVKEELYVMGIDGGMTGAISILLPKPGTFDVFTLVDMPMSNISKGKKWYDPEAITRLMNVHRVIVGLEESYRFAKLCKGIGILWACAKLAERVEDVVMIRPQQWQKFHGIKKADKDLSMEIARKLFPGQKKLLTLKKHHNRAESLLIADCLRRTYG